MSACRHELALRAVYNIRQRRSACMRLARGESAQALLTCLASRRIALLALRQPFLLRLLPGAFSMGGVWQELYGTCLIDGLGLGLGLVNPKPKLIHVRIDRLIMTIKGSNDGQPRGPHPSA